MPNYYDILSAERLRLCYDLAPPEVQQYLHAETVFILGSITHGMRVLDLGCGYGRVLALLGPSVERLFGVDLSLASLALAQCLLSQTPSVAGLVQARAPSLPFRPSSFDLVICPQNGIAAFRVDPRSLILAACHVAVPRGRVLLFSYAEEFWLQRLAWFRVQAAHGLVGSVDESASRDGTIVCHDGFSAGAITPDRFIALTHGIGSSVRISVLDHSSVVCDITV